jgi:hypothetical protein
VREKYCWLVADKPNEQGITLQPDKVVGHVLPPLMMTYCGGSLRCMKILIEVQLFPDFT